MASSASAASKKILVSGSTGLVGTALCKRLSELGFTVLPLSTSQHEGRIVWNPARSVFAAPIRDQLHAVIHLGGAPLKQVWNERMKYDFMVSRVNGTKLLTQLILHNPPPEVFICTTGIGFYGVPPGNFKGDGFTETSPPYHDKNERDKPYLHEVAAEVEAACDPVRQVTRVVNPRLAPVMDLKAGMLPKLIVPFKVGLGGPLGSGDQDFPWVSLRDVVNAYVFLLEHRDVTGPVNIASPKPTTQREFATALGEAMSRPSSLPFPAPLLRLLLGKESADSMLLSSRRIIPKKLLDHGFKFQDEDVGPFLRWLIASQQV